ncbi:START domain-containing protein [Danxiaibacter flavus]|uniref:START domain-containing protein n=1 Tax=Danxiaibacter flavus TaxID=3049108 RepID=A0ABV3ZIN8_9BACT|nr:START domain-containing protein [Chitinophagaceae bacterium DXS]
MTIKLRGTINTITVIVALICTTTSSYSQTDWKLVKDKDGIKVYTAPSHSSKFKAIKVECDMPGTFDKFISVLQDIPKQTEWVYATKKAYLVKKVSDNELYYYAETSIPWPMTNRDAAIKLESKKDSEKNTLLVTQTAVSNVVPKKKDIVRVASLDGRYEVSTADKKLHVVYYINIDPAGDMPPWIVNIFSTKGPYETFKALRERMEK